MPRLATTGIRSGHLSITRRPTAIINQPTDVRASDVTVTQASDLGGFLGGLIKKAGENLVDRFTGGGDQFAGPPPGSTDTPFQPCPEGQFLFNGSCVRFDPTAALPGGRPMISTTAAGGTLAQGVLGPARVPEVVGNLNGQPIRRCPAGMVLSVEDLCYVKGTKGLAAIRKWKPSARPVMSAADAKVIRRAATLQKKVKKLAGSVGFSCKKR